MVNETKPARFCHHCGAPATQPGAQFCTECGRDLLPRPEPATSARPAPKEESAPVAKPEPVRPVQPEPKRRRIAIFRRSTVFGLFDLVALAIGVVVVVVLIWPRNPPPADCQPLEPPSGHTIANHLQPLQGEIQGFTVLSSGQTYTIAAGKSLAVPSGATLLIEPGAQLSFEPGAALDVYGRLHACGTSRDNILFTSSRSLVEGSTSPPKAGDWVGIRFHSGSDNQSVIAHARIRYAGSGNHGAIHLEASSPNIFDITIGDSAWFPISLDADSQPSIGGELTFEYVPVTGIEVRKSTMTKPREWSDTKRVYVVTERVTVGSDAKLVIEPGVTVKFATNGALVVEGRLQAVSTKGSPIILTSLRDDQVSGDTDLRASDPQPGDWIGIVFKQSSRDCILQGVTIKYAGNAKYGVAPVHLEAASPEITGNEIVHSAGFGISADVNSFPTIQDNTFSDIARGTGLGIRGSELTAKDIYRWDQERVDLVRVVTDRVTIGPEATLVIVPGTVLKFEPKGLLEVQGRLQAESGEGGKEQVIFTSVHDDDFGGDTDGTTAPQANRSWGWIIFKGSNEESVVQGTVIRFAGIRLEGASPRLLSNQILDCPGYAISADVTSNPTVQGNTLKGNQVNGMEIRAGERKMAGEWHWDDSRVDLVRIITGKLVVGPEALMIVEPRTVVMFGKGAQLEVKGALQLSGEEGSEIVFTSWRDDQVVEDVVPGAAQPQPGDWGGIIFHDISNDALSSLQHTDIRYATQGLRLNGSSPSVRQVRITRSAKQGLVCDKTSNPLLDQVTLQENGEAGSNCPDWGTAP
jgi:hypothetical protein